MKTTVMIINILWVLSPIHKRMMAITSPMLFDAPDSDKNTAVWRVMWTELASQLSSSLPKFFL